MLLMLLTIWTSLGWDFSKPSTDELQSAQRKLAQLRILFLPRGFVSGKFCKPGNALRLLTVRFGERADFRLERAEQLEQFAFAVIANGIRAPNLRLNFANRFFDHNSKVCASENSASAFTNARCAAKWVEPFPRFLRRQRPLAWRR